MEKETYKHPSYGQIQMSRINSNNTRFYGSDLPQSNYIQVEIAESEMERNLADDRYFTKGRPIIRVRLSSAQFSEMITSMNIGQGVCCTIEKRDGESIEELVHTENRKEFVHRKFEEKMREFGNQIKEKEERAIELIAKKTLNNNDIKELTSALHWISQEVNRNIPFYMECFQETMDKVVLESKMEIENAVSNKITNLGLIAYNAAQNDKLLNENTD